MTREPRLGGGDEWMRMESVGRQMMLRGLEALELRHALEMEKAARAVADQGLAETAHDLRAALASILGYAQIMADPRQDDFSPRQVAERIARLALGLCEVTSDLIGRSPGASRSSVQRKRFSVPRMLESCAQAVEPLCREKHLALRLALPPRGECVGDTGLIQRMVHNLLTNAVRYTERGEIWLRAQIEPGVLRIEVQDTGIGMAAEDQQRIFDEFCRLDSGRRMEPLGTGLGLATVKRLCERLGGRIQVESAPAAGSTFRLWLPRSARRRRPGVRQAELFPVTEGPEAPVSRASSSAGGR
jgi:signal transduction histidine kinase